MTTPRQRQAYVWYLPDTPTARLAHAQRLRDVGALTLRVKAGGDHGLAWIPGRPSRGFAQPQWDRAWLAPYEAQGLVVSPWFYVWPDGADRDAIVAALRHERGTATSPLWLGLNPEAEWRVQSHDNPWHTLAEANDAAYQWVQALRHDLKAYLGLEVKIAVSAVPSWADFPYEGFARAADQLEPQHYWPDHLMAGGEDQVEAHVRRAGPDTPVVPLLALSREYDDDQAVALAEDALADFGPLLDGFSAWEVGNDAFQWGALKRVYALLDSLDAQVQVAGIVADKRARLLAAVETVPYFAKGDALVEGELLLPDGTRERTIRYEKAAYHTYGDTVVAFFPDGEVSYRAYLERGAIQEFR